MSEPRWTTTRCLGRFSLLTVLLALTAASARAQYPVDQQANMNSAWTAQTGRLLDVNPQIGGSPWNYTRPASPLLGGNLSASGVLGRGMSLRSVSPISDPTALRMSLGSGSLYTFRRDSVSAASPALGMGALAQPYYDPATTAATAGFLQGYAGGMATPREGAGPLDLRLQMRMSVQRVNLGMGPNPLAPVALPEPAWTSSTWRPAATASSIFGTEPPPLPLLIGPEDARSRQLPREETVLGLLRGQGEADQDLFDARVRHAAEALATPLGTALRDELYPQLGLRMPEAEPSPWGGRGGLVVPELSAGAPETAMPGRPRITDPSVMPGYDVYNDLRLALFAAQDPNAPALAEMQEMLRAQPELAMQLDERAALNVAAYLQQTLSTPLRTLTGGGASALNDHMLKAESLMDIGHYGEAAARYESARRAGPTNPLPLIGKGHALLAAGEYRSAAFVLLKGLGLFPELTRFAIDLQDLMGGGEIVDIRRADIMKLLKQRENPELRFLLGYLEYHSGDRERGLENLRKAAEDLSASALIARYPGLLRGEGAMPVPKLWDDNSGAPEPLLLPESPGPGGSPVETGPAETLVIPPLEESRPERPEAPTDEQR